MSSYHPSPTTLNLFLLLFALSALLGILPAYEASLSLAALIAVLASTGSYFAISFGARSQAAVRIVASAGMLVASAFALYLITQYGHLGYEKGGIISQLGQITTLLPYLGGFAPQPNAAATFVELAVPLGVALTVSSRKTLQKMVWGICTGIVLYAVFLSVSRGAWLALGLTAVLAGAVTVLNRLPRRTATALIGLGGLALVAGLIAIVALGPDRIPLLASTFSRASDRGRLFQNSLQLLGDYPFTGIGLGDTFAMVYSRYALMIYVPFLTYAHNLPLSIWLNQGILGLVAFAGVMAAFYLYVYRVNRTARPSALFHGAWMGVTVTWLHGLTDAPQYADSRWVMPMLFAWMGLAIASGRRALHEVTPAASLHLAAGVRISSRRILIIAAAAILIAAVVFNRPLLAAWRTNLGAIAETRAELNEGLTPAQRLDGFDAAITEYRGALDIGPAQPNANRRLGNLLVKLDRFDEAVPYLEAAFAADPTRHATIKGLGLAYVWVGRINDAVRTFRLLEDPAGMAEELYVWGSYRTDQQRPLLAAYAYDTATTMLLDNINLDVWLLVADTYRAADQVEAARAWYNRVLAVEPDNQRATEALDQIGSSK